MSIDKSMVTISRSLSITDLFCNLCWCLDRHLGAVLSWNFLAILPWDLLTTLPWDLLAVLLWNFDWNLNKRGLKSQSPWKLKYNFLTCWQFSLGTWVHCWDGCWTGTLLQLCWGTFLHFLPYRPYPWRLYPPVCRDVNGIRKDKKLI